MSSLNDVKSLNLYTKSWPATSYLQTKIEVAKNVTIQLDRETETQRQYM